MVAKKKETTYMKDIIALAKKADTLQTSVVENMVYIGDSDTDIPCMRLVKSKGGTSIGVHDPKKHKANDPLYPAWLIPI